MGLFTKAVSVIARGLGLTDPRLAQFFSGGETDAGERVTIDSAMQVGTVWACVRLIATMIATLPLRVYRENAQGFAEVDPSHPLSVLLRARPNADMTAVEFWEAVVAHLLLWGNAYIAVTRFGARIVALYPMRPDAMSVRRERDGSLTYTYTWGGQINVLRDSEVLHIKGFSLDGLKGISPIAQARNNIGAARAAERSSASIFRNGMRPSGVLIAPNYLTDPQREDAKKILAGFKGASQTGSTPLLEGGWTWAALMIPPEDAQMLETMGFDIERMCRWFEVPPVMIGHMNKQSSWGTGVEQIMLHFYTTCLRAHLIRLETAMAVSLLTPSDLSKGVSIKFAVEGLLRADSAGRAAFYSSMVQNGIYTRNYCRALEGLPPLPGGDELTVQANLLPIADLGLVARLPTERQVALGASVSMGSTAQSSPQNGDPKPIPEIRQ